MKELAVQFFHVIGIPAEYPDKNILLEVTGQKGFCPYKHKDGQVFLFNLKNRRELCPASFYATYPFLIKKALDYSSKNMDAEDNKFHCPDPYGVHYTCPDIDVNCEDFFPFDFPMNGFCPLAFYSVFPYYLTLVHGGRFEWVRSGENVKVQCPKVNGVIMEVELTRFHSPGDGAIKVKIDDTLGHCPKQHKKGDMFVFDSRKQPMNFEEMNTKIALKYFKDKDGSLTQEHDSHKGI
jgi:uncharacterized repeat protein (TIGR04076 family)